MGRPPILRPPVTELRLRVGETERTALQAITTATEESPSQIVRRLLLEESERVERAPTGLR